MKKTLLFVLAALFILSGVTFASDVDAATSDLVTESVAMADAATKQGTEVSEAEASKTEENVVNAAALGADGEEVEYEICRHFITLNANPYAFQHITLHNKDTFNSKYGFGVNAGYRYSFGLFNAGLEVGYNNFKYEDYDRYHILSFTGLCGISYYFTPKFFGDFDLGAGLDLRFMNDETRANFSALARVNAGYWLSDLIALTGGADIKLAWQDHEVRDLDSTDFGVYVNVGTKISL